MSDTNTKPRHKDTWSFKWASLPCEVTLHSKGELVNGGKGIWCYYVYVPEQSCSPEFFKKLWLRDIRKKFYECSPERITHDYDHLFIDCKWHCGMTFYQKHGHSKGHRCIQLGCDFSHYWDEGMDYSLEDVVRECQQTAELIAKRITERANAEKATTNTLP